MARRPHGLAWQRTSDALRAFISRHGTSAPRRALFCTYDIDVPRFEAVLLPELTRRGRQFRTLVLSDAGALQMHLRVARVGRFARYQIAPVRCSRGGVFHSKILLLMAGMHYLVGVGSANLTAGGLGGNLELMLFADQSTHDGRRLLGGIAAFFDALLKTPSVSISRRTREFIELVLAGVRRDQDSVLHSLREALLPQITVLCCSAGIAHAREVLVLSPWHSAVETNPGTDAAVLPKIRHSLGGEITLYTEGRSGCGPNLGKSAKVYIRTEQRVPDDEADDAAFDRRPRRVHAKAYLIRGQKGSLLFFGSANCTHAALTRSARGGGNVELLVGSRLTDQEDSAFEADLADLFAPAIRSFTPEPPTERKPAGGTVLCGHLLAGRNGPYLEVEAPSVISGRVFIAPNPSGEVVPVVVRGGIGEVYEAVAMRRLFSEKLPSRGGDSWGCVLWERSGPLRVPFPVFVPVMGSGTFTSDAALEDLIWEEAGWWPPQDSNRSTHEEPLTEDLPLQSEYDEDLETLTQARHQGILDRLAITVAILRRRICSHRLSREYAEERLDVLRRQISQMDIASHVKGVLLEHLEGSSRRRAK